MHDFGTKQDGLTIRLPYTPRTSGDRPSYVDRKMVRQRCTNPTKRSNAHTPMTDFGIAC